MARLVPAFEQFFDASGEPLAYGKLFFYETGSSTTLKDTFADISEITKNTNPVILNGDGRCPDVFGTGSYRVKLTDKDSVQLVQRDPVGGSGSQEFGADWVPDIVYQAGDVVRDDQDYYQGQTNNNRGNRPSTDGGVNWIEWPSEGFSLTSEGAIAIGSPVVVNFSGNAQQVEGSDGTTGTASVFEAAQVDSVVNVYDPNAGRFVFFYSDQANSDFGTAVVATRLGNALSFGSPVVFNSFLTTDISASYDSAAQKIVVSFKNGFTGNGQAIVGTVSGASISFGTAVSFITGLGGASLYSSCSYDSANNKTVICHADVSNDFRAIVGTVAGTSISFGVHNRPSADNVDFIKSTYDPVSGRIVAAYRNTSLANRQASRVGTVSGTNISFGSEATVTAASFPTRGVFYEQLSNKIIVLGNNDVYVGTVSGSSISYGSQSVFNADCNSATGSVSSAVGRIQIVANDPVVGETRMYSGSVSGESFVVETDGLYEASELNATGEKLLAADSEQIVFAYSDPNNSGFGLANTIQPGSSTLLNGSFIGFSSGEYADGDTARVNTSGAVDANQAGLSAGVKYYVNNDGGLVVSETGSYAGISLSATEILVKG